MDSQERDRSIERLLRQSRQVLRGRQDAGPTDACLDAEALAAWADGALSGVELEMAVTHAASCARCQSLVGELAKIESAVPPAEPARRGLGWLTWLVPLSAAAVVMAVWVAVPRNGPDRAFQSPPSAETERKAETTAQQPAAQADQQQAPPSGRDANAAPTQAGAADRLEARMRSDAAPAESDRSNRQAATSAGGTPLGQPTPALPAPSMATPPAAAPPASASVLEPAPPIAARALAETIGVEIISPDPLVRWRIVVGSRVERSIDGGATWETTSTGIATELTAGAAPTASVCWLVGRGGVVLVSTEAGSWRRVPFPQVTDLSAVRARDIRSVSVTTADGRIFSTTDAGASWVPGPLQGF